MVPWPTADQNFKMPLTRWLPSSATSGLKEYTGSAFPKWKGDLLAGGLAGKVVDRVRVKGDNLIERETILFGLGRTRDIAIGPDGFIYVDGQRAGYHCSTSSCEVTDLEGSPHPVHRAAPVYRLLHQKGAFAAPFRRTLSGEASLWCRKIIAFRTDEKR